MAKSVLHDQGGEFENKLFHCLEQLSGTCRLRTTPYHPEGNGQCERMNQTILGMLRSLEESQKSKWKEHLSKLVHAYNCTKNSATGFSPYFLLFGREPRLPLDFILETPRQHEAISHQQYVQQWQSAMAEAYRIAAEHSQKGKISDRERRNHNPPITPVHVGDRVLVKNVADELGGHRKIKSYWEQKVYKVIEKLGDREVTYKVQAENDPSGRFRVLHRNLLFPCPGLPVEQAQKHSSRIPIKKRDVLNTRDALKTSKLIKMATGSPAHIVKNSDIDETSDCENSDDETIELYPNELAVLLQSRATTQSIKRNPQSTPTPADAHPQEASTSPSFPQIEPQTSAPVSTAAHEKRATRIPRRLNYDELGGPVTRRTRKTLLALGNDPANPSRLPRAAPAKSAMTAPATREAPSK